MRQQLLLAAATVVACDVERYDSGLGEAMRVREGTFHPGALPADPDAASPTVLAAAGVNYVVTQGQGSVVYTGLATPDAWSVGVTFPTVSTGYWVVPVDGPDVTQDDNLVFSLTVDFTAEVPPGLQALTFAALDGDRAPGPPYESLLCILPDAAAGTLAACDPDATPPNAVLMLSWDTPVDLDLIVVTPSGKVVSAKAPTTAEATLAGIVPSEAVNDPSTGHLSRDSNANCVFDGVHRESLVFSGAPPAGEYQLFASLHSACGRSNVHYAVTQYTRVDDGDEHPVVATELGVGVLTAVAADAGASFGTLVATVSL